MRINDIIKKFTKIKYIIIISLILSFITGVVFAEKMNRIKYRSSADINYFKMSSDISASLDANFYYLFFKYFSNDKNFNSELIVDYYKLEAVQKNVHEFVLEQGYHIDYETFKKGIYSYFRDSDNRRRVMVTFENKELSIITLEKLLDEAMLFFNDTMKRRVIYEVDYRKKQASILKNKIESMTEDIHVAKNMLYSQADGIELYLMEKELSVLEKTHEENLEYIIKLEQFTEFNFFEISLKYQEITERAIALPKNKFSIGIISMVTVLMIWMMFFYVTYIMKEVREINEKT